MQNVGDDARLLRARTPPIQPQSRMAFTCKSYIAPISITTRMRAVWRHGRQFDNQTATREQVRADFAWSAEFHMKVRGISPYPQPNGAVPPDGLQGITYDSASNRIKIFRVQ